MSYNYVKLKNRSGFTLIELMTVVALLGILYTMVQPLLGGSLEKSREAVLKYNLSTIRQVINRFYRDHERYPRDLNELVSSGYLRTLPHDPITERTDTWIIISSQDSGSGFDLYDIRSGAPGYEDF